MEGRCPDSWHGNHASLIQFLIRLTGNVRATLALMIRRLAECLLARCVRGLSGKPVSYTFRLRFNRAPVTTILTDAPEIVLPAPEAGVSLALRATSGKSLKDDEGWALVGEGYRSEQDAREAGSRLQNILALALARLRIGANFGNRAPIHGQYIKTQFTLEGLQQTQQLLKDERHLNDDPGLSVYLSEPKPKFVSFTLPFSIAKNPGNVEDTFRSVLTLEPPLTTRERVAFDLFFDILLLSKRRCPLSPSGHGSRSFDRNAA